MSILEIKSSTYSPKILFDPKKNIYEISGQSIPENAIETFAPVFKWIDENITKIDKKIEFNINLDYFNTASAKILLDILIKLEKSYNSGVDMHINWYHDEDDLDMQTAGEDYSEIVSIPFTIIPLKEDN